MAIRGIIAALLFVASPACAQEAVFLPAEAHADWQAIGRLNVIGFKSRTMCTATLIAPDKVLTAAHCVLMDDGQQIPLDRFRFVAGWFRGDYVAIGQVKSIKGVEAFQKAAQHGRMSVAADSAVLTLVDPIHDVTPLTTARPSRFAKVRILGYRWDRPHALSDTGMCHYSRLSLGEIQMTCPATFGNSGGPLLQEKFGQWHVVGVVSAISASHSLAAPLP